jgi:hypothetical protein
MAKKGTGRVSDRSRGLVRNHPGDIAREAGAVLDQQFDIRTLPGDRIHPAAPGIDGR